MPRYSRIDKIKNLLYLVISISLILATHYINITLLLIVTISIGYISFFRLNIERFNKVIRALPFFVGIVFMILPYLNNDILIELNYRPKITDGRDIIEVDVKQTGFGFKNIDVAYIYGITLEETRGIDHFEKLPGDFEIEPRTSLNCSLITNPVKSEVYFSEDETSCYIKHNIQENSCIIVQVNFSISAENFFGIQYDKDLTYYYPELGKYSIGLDTPIGKCINVYSEDFICGKNEKCINESDVNFSNLIFSHNVTTKDFNYPPAFCSRGRLDKEFCQNAFSENVKPTATLVTPAGNLTQDLIFIGYS